MSNSDPSTDNNQSSEQPRLWLRRADQFFVGVCLTLLAGLLIVYWGRLSGWGMRPVEIERLPANKYQYKLDINTASWVEWSQLDGIGETLARRIVADREQNGPFRSVEEISRVKGIGPKTLENIRPWLELREKPAEKN